MSSVPGIGRSGGEQRGFDWRVDALVVKVLRKKKGQQSDRKEKEQ